MASWCLGEPFTIKWRTCKQCFRNLKLLDSIWIQRGAFYSEGSEYLGRFVCACGVEPDTARVEAVTTWPRHTCVQDVKSFQGLASYVLALLLWRAPWHWLHYTSTLKRYCLWPPDTETEFIWLKEALSYAHVLAYLDPSASFILDTDASNKWISAVLSPVLFQPNPCRTTV